MYRILLLAFISFSPVAATGITMKGTRISPLELTAQQKIACTAKIITLDAPRIKTSSCIKMSCECINGTAKIEASRLLIVANVFEAELDVKITKKSSNPIIIITNTPEDEVRRLITTTAPIKVESLSEFFKYKTQFLTKETKDAETQTGLPEINEIPTNSPTKAVGSPISGRNSDIYDPFKS